MIDNCVPVRMPLLRIVNSNKGHFYHYNKLVHLLINISASLLMDLLEDFNEHTLILSVEMGEYCSS